MEYHPSPPRSPMKSSVEPRRVSFDSQPIYSRQPRDDETFVVRAFVKHALHCTACADPYANFKAGYTLCAKGHARALDLTQYFFYHSGHIYSLVDREGKQRVLVELPSKYVAVQSLLKAVARGLRLRKAAPPAVHYDDYRPTTPRDTEYYYPQRYAYDYESPRSSYYETPASSYYTAAGQPVHTSSKAYYSPALSYSAQPASYQYTTPSTSHGYYYR